MDLQTTLKRNLIHCAASKLLQSELQNLVRSPFSEESSRKATELKKRFLRLEEDMGQIVVSHYWLLSLEIISISRHVEFETNIFAFPHIGKVSCESGLHFIFGGQCG